MLDVGPEAVCAPEGDLIDHPTEFAVNILVLGQGRHVCGPPSKPIFLVIGFGNVIDHHLQLGKLLSYERDVLDSVGITLEIKRQSVI